jgi:hypothetical protein
VTDYTVVIPTIGRSGLLALLADLQHGRGPTPAEIVVVDDRPDTEAPVPTLPIEHFHDVRVVRSGGRGPAAARNAGWRSARSEWIAFLDDDVRVPPDWPARLADDLAALPPEVAASQARITVPLPAHRRPTDDERGTAGLANARWITADMAYRRRTLAEAGGFDERFPRAYREDADLALRVTKAGHRIERGERITTHPTRRAAALASLRAQAGNADNALMRHKHGRSWRSITGAGGGRIGRHALVTAAALAAVIFVAGGQRRRALAAAAGWMGLTAEFAVPRIAAGPCTAGEIGRMLLTSVLIPPAACAHRLAGELRHRRAGPDDDVGDTPAAPVATAAESSR